MKKKLDQLVANHDYISKYGAPSTEALPTYTKLKKYDNKRPLKSDDDEDWDNDAKLSSTLDDTYD